MPKVAKPPRLTQAQRKYFVKRIEQLRESAMTELCEYTTKCISVKDRTLEERGSSHGRSSVSTADRSFRSALKAGQISLSDMEVDGVIWDDDESKFYVRFTHPLLDSFLPKGATHPIMVSSDTPMHNLNDTSELVEMTREFCDVAILGQPEPSIIDEYKKRLKFESGKVFDKINKAMSDAGLEIPDNDS